MRWQRAGWISVVIVVVGLMTPVQASASAPAVSLSATSIDFGGVAWLQKAARTITLTNTGDTSLTGVTVRASHESIVPVDFAADSYQPCSPSLPPGGQCLITVNFQPQSGGPRQDTLSIYDNAADSPQQVALTGTGTGAVVRFTPDYLQFLEVPVGTTSAPKSFSAVNAGDAPVTFSSVALSAAVSASKWFAITNDGCTGKTLGPGQRCSVSTTASPDAVTSQGALVYFFDNAGSGQQVYDFDKAVEGLQASGGGPLLDAPEPNAFIQDVGTASLPTRVVARDSGTEPLHITSVAVDNPSTGYTIAGDTCTGATLVLNTLFTPLSSCYVDVVFAPTTAGLADANLVFHDNEYGGTHNVRLRGSGQAPAGELSASALDFGFQQVGVASSPRTVTISNPTNQALNITSVTFSASSTSFQLADDSCSGTTVPAGGTCSVGVTFTPPFPYLFSATMSITDNAPKPVQTVSLRGEGSSPTFTIATSAIHFGNLRARSLSPAQTVTVTNTSAGPLNLSFFQTNLAIGHTGCTVQLAVGQSCALEIMTTPSGDGPDSALLKVVDQSFDQQVVEADWSGISGYANIVTTVGPNLEQRVGDTLSGYAIVYDSGLDALKIGSVDLPPNPAVSITSDGCSNQILAVGARCVLSLTINPTAAGTWTTTLSIPTDDPLRANPATVSFHGIASPPPEPVFLPSSVAFGAQRVGTETTQIVWLDNGIVLRPGTLPLSVSSVGVVGPDASSYRVVWDGCSGLTVGPEFSCPVAVGFNPTSRGTLTASLLFNDDGNSSPQAVSLSGVGLAPAITLTPATLDFGSVVVKSKSEALTLTVSSSGDFPVKITGESIIGPNKGDFTITSENCKNQTLASGVSCQVTMVFRPDVLGGRSATLSLTDNALSSPQLVGLAGSGVSK